MEDWTELQKVAARAAGVGAVVAGAVGVIQQRHATIGAWCRSVLSGALVATGAILGIQDSGISPAMQAFIAGALAVVAQDLIDGVVHVGALFRKDPIEFVRMIARSLRGIK